MKNKVIQIFKEKDMVKMNHRDNYLISLGFDEENIYRVFKSEDMFGEGLFVISEKNHALKLQTAHVGPTINGDVFEVVECPVVKALK